MSENTDVLEQDWKTEYEQLNEDRRQYVNMGWIATFAVIVLDAIIIGETYSTRNHILFGSLAIIGGVGTVLIGLETLKWVKRTKVIVKRLKEIERVKHWSRFGREESWFLRLPLGSVLVVLLVMSGVFMTILGIIALIQPCLILIFSLLFCHI